MMNNFNKRQQQQQYPFERFAAIRRFTGFDFLKTNPFWMLYIADTNGQFNLWRQRSTLSPDGEQYAAYQLTHFIDESVRHVFSSPVDNSVIFFADDQGNEKFQIFKIDNIFDSWPEQITFDPKIRQEWGQECFSHDGKHIVYGSNEGNPSNMLVYVRNLKSDSNDDRFCVTNRDGWFIPGHWSPDNKKINCSQLVTLTDYTIWILDVESREMRNIDLGNTGKSRFMVGPWSADGKGFYVISDLNREFAGVAFYDLDKSRLEWILTPQHDIEIIDVSSDGSTIAWAENVEGYSRLFLKNLVDGETKEIGPADVSPNGVIEDIKFSPDGKRIGVMMDSPTSPTNIFVMDLSRSNEGRYEQITTSLLANIPKHMLIKPEIIKYKSFDGLEVSAFLYIPQNSSIDKANSEENAQNQISNTTTDIRDRKNNNNKNINSTANQKYGAILSIHGGPTAQERPYYDYSGLYQYLAHNGVAVIAPNYRGSTGYGKSFEKRIYHDWGGNELRDLEHAIKWLLSKDWVDAKRIGVFGASFGGFATLSCITRLPGYNWKAAVDIVGPSNLVTFVNTVPEHWKKFTGELVGDPVKEESFLKERSPINYVDAINPITNLLVIQGANDPRVAKDESDQIVKRLQDKGMDVDYMVFEDEGHGFTKYSNQVKAIKKSAEFLVERLS
ncbi:MAG: prolyl oligopeptidase family serine peptidase [Candidatus Nitrosocosmicus sp.]